MSEEPHPHALFVSGPADRRFSGYNRNRVDTKIHQWRNGWWHGGRCMGIRFSSRRWLSPTPSSRCDRFSREQRKNTLSLTLAVPRAGDGDFSFLAPPPNSPPKSPPPCFSSLGSRDTRCEPRDTRCEPPAAGAAAGLRPATSTTVNVTSANVTWSPLASVARPTCPSPKPNHCQAIGRTSRLPRHPLVHPAHSQRVLGRRVC
jgi:hypothetical protein